MPGTHASLTTGSKPFLFSLGDSGALAALPHDAMKIKCRDVYQSHNPDSSVVLEGAQSFYSPLRTADRHGQGSGTDQHKQQMSRQKASIGCTRERPELSFFSPNRKPTQSRIKRRSAATEVGKVAIKKYHRASLPDEQRSF